MCFGGGLTQTCAGTQYAKAFGERTPPQGVSGPNSESRFRSLDPDPVACQNSVGELSKDTSEIKFVMNCRSLFFSEIYEPKVWKNARSCDLWWKIIGSRSRNDDFPYLISSSASKDTSLVKYSVLSEVVNRKTDRQTDKRRIKHNLIGGGKSR